MSIIEKGKDQFLTNDFNEKIFEFDKIKIGEFGMINPMIKKTSGGEEGRVKVIWHDILLMASKWQINEEPIVNLWKNFDDKKLMFKVQIDPKVFDKAIVLKK